MIFSEQEKRQNINAIINRYGTKELAYEALQIGLNRAKECKDEITVKKFQELITYFDATVGCFSLPD